MTTGDVQRLARENGLRFPPDPGAAELSQIGGNIACNAGGPHAFKYGVTGHWVTGIEAVIPPGEIVTFGGPIRKDVAGYDLKSLLVGSEGTLGLVTAAWLRLIPAPELELPGDRPLPRRRGGRVARSSACSHRAIVPAAIEYLDGVLAHLRRRRISVRPPGGRGVHGHHRGRRRERPRHAGSPRSCARRSPRTRSPCTRPQEPSEVADLWRWRAGVGVRDPRAARRRVQRGHRGAARPAARRRPRDARDRRAPRRARRSRSVTQVTATSTRRSSSRPTTPTRSAAPTPPATSSSTSRCASAEPSAASTASAG